MNNHEDPTEFDDGLVSIGDSQSGFVPKRGTTDAILVALQMQEKCLAVSKHIYMVFQALENEFNCVPRIFSGRSRESYVIQGVNTNARVSQEFPVILGVHHGSVISPLLIIIVLEALPHMLCHGAPWEDIYADHLIIITESLEEHVRRLFI